MEDDEYASITKKPLKLATDKTKSKKKKLKTSTDTVAHVSKDSKILVSKSTKAEAAFLSRQAEVAEKRILKKASKTHKQRVEEFNKHLDSLSEHYDIPKVSWTK